MAFYEQHIHAKPTTFLSKYVFFFDHKVIGKASSFGMEFSSWELVESWH